MLNTQKIEMRRTAITNNRNEVSMLSSFRHALFSISPSALLLIRPGCPMQIEEAVPENYRKHMEGFWPFCKLSNQIMGRLRQVSSRATYRKNTKLFFEGQEPRGVFVLCIGQAKLSTSSSAGRAIITRFAEPGDALGLSAVISKRPYGATAEMLVDGQATSWRTCAVPDL